MSLESSDARTHLRHFSDPGSHGTPPAPPFLLSFALLIFALSLIACSPGLAPGSAGNAGGSGQPTPATLGQRTKTSGCVSVNALPDAACTPGAIFPDATVAKICVSGYSSSVRDVPTSEKDQVYAEYGIASHSPGQYEVDHLISLEIGGSNDIANLWPEPAEPRPGFHEKDQVENYLHDQVCSGAMPLSAAQLGIAQNWRQFYDQAASPQGGVQSNGNPQGGSPATVAPLIPATAAPLIPATAAPAVGKHRYVASSKATTYYYCETDPAWQTLSSSNLVWSDDPATFIAKGLKLHRPC